MFSDIPLPGTLPQPCTVRHLVESYFDINGIPRRHFFRMMSFFSQNEMEKEKLEEFDSAEGQEELYSYCNRPRRTILEVNTHDYMNYCNIQHIRYE